MKKNNIQTITLEAISKIVRKEVGGMKKDIGAIKTRLNSVDQRLNSVDKRLGSISKKVSNIDQRLKDFSEDYTQADLETRMVTIESKLGISTLIED